MDGGDRLAMQSSADTLAPFEIPPDLCARFTAETYREISDAARRRARIADLVAAEIVPRLAALHAAVAPADHPTPENIAELARLVLSHEAQDAAAYVAGLKARGLSVEMLFTELLEPAARLLGQLWDRDQVDFIDVTLGVGRLQALLSVFNCTHEISVSSELRSVLMLTVHGEQHSFGIAMVERLLEAGGWRVGSEREASPTLIAERVQDQWFAVAGVTLSNERNLDKVAASIATIRRHSRNRAIGIMVGGPIFTSRPELAAAVGADGTASTGTTAVVLAQKLLDRAIIVEAVAPQFCAERDKSSEVSVARPAH